MIALLLATALVLVTETALGTFVATRAWEYRPARMFALVVASLSVQNVISLVRAQITDPTLAYATAVSASLNLAGLSTIFLLFFSALFVPQWWEEPRRIRWICLPYVLIFIILCIDLVGRTGLIVNGIEPVTSGYRWRLVQPGASIIVGLFAIGWLVLLMILGVAFIRERRMRPLIGLLFGAITLSSAIGLIGSWIGLPDRVDGLIQTMLILSALAYAVLRTQLFAPTRAALELAVQAMRDAVVVLDQDGIVGYANSPALALGIVLKQPIGPALQQAGLSADTIAALVAKIHAVERWTFPPVTLGTRQIECLVAPVADSQGRIRGTLLLGRDITEVEQRNVLLEWERARLDDTVQKLEAGQTERAELAATVQKLSLPLIPVLDGVLALPLVGDFDGARIEEFTSVLMAGIERTHAQLVLLDITGIPLLDTAGAAGLLRGVRAAALLGARCVLVGVRPEIAQSLVSLGVPLGELATAATLQQAVHTELRARERALLRAS
jgi:anti-anti-sigma regulatory factor/PAS domain-containing protein